AQGHGWVEGVGGETTLAGLGLGEIQALGDLGRAHPRLQLLVQQCRVGLRVPVLLGPLDALVELGKVGLRLRAAVAVRGAARGRARVLVLLRLGRARLGPANQPEASDQAHRDAANAPPPEHHNDSSLENLGWRTPPGGRTSAGLPGRAPPARMALPLPAGARLAPGPRSSPRR